MSNALLPCVHASELIVPENGIAFPGRPRLEVLLNIGPIVSNTTCETAVSRDSQPRVVPTYNPLRIRRLILLCLLLVLLAWVGPVCRSHCGEQTGAGNDPERSASGGCSPGTDGFSALDSLEKGYSPLRHHGSKRKRDRDPPLPSRSSSRKPTRRTFACPFYLHDRIRHSDCLNISLRRLSDVRQHLLERAHNQVVHCPVCGITFAGRTAEARQRRDAHVQAATCVPSSSPFNYPGITEDEEQRIREIARNTRTTHYNEVQRWYMIWDFLFPGAPRPDSPFLTDVPDIQRVVDWTDAIFGGDLWQELPNQPWTPAVPREERRLSLSHIIQSFIAQARVLVGQSAGQVEDDHGADTTSYVDVETPDPSGTTANLRVASMASFDSNSPIQSRPRYLSPTSPTRSRRQSLNPHTLGQMDSGTGQLPTGIAPVSHRPLSGPAVDALQNTQQGVTPEEATGIQDPNIPLLTFDDFSTEYFVMFGIEWPNLTTGNDDAGPDDNHAPTGEGGPRGRD